MISKRLAVTFAVGLAVIVAAVCGVLYMQRGAHVELRGQILKVRSVPLDENSSLAVLDFRFANPADYPFVVREVTVVMEDQAGNRYQGSTVSETDARRTFEALPTLGQKYNQTLVMRDRVPPRSSQDRMVAVRFEIPEARLEARKLLLIRIEDVDGPVSENQGK